MTGLALSGGSAKGPFHLGALAHLAACDTYPMGFGYLTGTGAGAINAALLAAVPTGPVQIPHFLARAETLWERIAEVAPVGPRRCWSAASGLWRPAVWDNRELRQLLAETIDFDAVMLGTPCTVVAHDLRSGLGRVWDLREAATPAQLVGILLGAFALPGVLPPEEFEGGLYVDGGPVDTAPAHRLIDSGCSEVLAITGYSAGRPGAVRDLRTAAAAATRALDGAEARAVRADLERVVLTNRLVAASGQAPGKRWVDVRLIEPAEGLGDPGDFSPDLASARRRAGQEAARAALSR